MIPSLEARGSAGAAARASAAIAVVLLVFFAPALSPARQFGYFDNGRMHVPMKRFIAQELSAGRFPTWNPYAGLGAPLVADPVNAVQHPFNLLLLALPFDVGFKLWVILLFPVAALGTWAWARKLGLGEGASLLAGLLFALSGYAVSETGNMQYLGALAFFPWMLYAAQAFVERATPGRAALAGLASALCAASGDPQGWALALATSGVAAVASPPRGVTRPRAALRVAGASAAAVVGAIPFVLPILAWIPHSSRAEPFDALEYEHFNLLPVRIAELAIPHLFRIERHAVASRVYEAYAGSSLTPFPWASSVYLGFGAVCLAVLGALHAARARLFLALGALFTWMALGHWAGFGEIARRLPLLGNFRYWEKLVAWPSLLVAVAAGFGLHALCSSVSAARRFGIATGFVGALLIGLGGIAAAFPAPFGSVVAPRTGDLVAAGQMAANLGDGLVHAGAFALALGAAAFLLRPDRPRRRWLIGAVLVFDVAAGNAGAYVLFDAEATHPPSAISSRLRREEGLQRMLTPFRPYSSEQRFEADMESTWRWGASNLYAAWNVPERIGNLETYSGMLPVRTNRFWRRVGGRALPTVAMWSYGWVLAPPGGEVTVASLLHAEPQRALVNETGATLFRFPSRPRTYLAAELASVDRRHAIEFVLDPTSAASKSSVVEGEVPAGYSPPGGTSRIVEDSPDEVRVVAEADRPALVVLNDTFTVGWRAAVDGAPAEILPVNYLARGVWVGPGRHEVRYTYRTPWLRESWAITAAGALALAPWQMRRRSLRGRRAAEPPARGPA